MPKRKISQVRQPLLGRNNASAENTGNRLSLSQNVEITHNCGNDFPVRTENFGMLDIDIPDVDSANIRNSMLVLSYLQN